MTRGVPVILRPGGFPRARLEEFLGVKIAPPPSGVTSRAGKEEPARSPGMKYRHYAPDCRVIAVPCGGDMREKVIKAYDDCERNNLKAAILTLKPNAHLYGRRVVLPLGADSAHAAHALFRLFRRAEKLYDVLICEELPEGDAESGLSELGSESGSPESGSPESGLSEAFNERLRRAARL
jgi:L-threonylcarbamoyladenylate synthase